jgi:hypothetical protein
MNGIIFNRTPRAIASSRGRSNLLGGATWELYQRKRCARSAANSSCLISTTGKPQVQMVERLPARNVSAPRLVPIALRTLKPACKERGTTTPLTPQSGRQRTSVGVRAMLTIAANICGDGQARITNDFFAVLIVVWKGSLLADQSIRGKNGCPYVSLTAIAVSPVVRLGYLLALIMSSHLRRAGVTTSQTFNHFVSRAIHPSGTRLSTIACNNEHRLSQGWRLRNGMAA